MSDTNSVLSLIRRVFSKHILATASALYVLQLSNIVFPLLVVPYLARVLSPDMWGLFVFVQAIGVYLQLIVSYSFDLSASREVARCREDSVKLGDLAARVMGARLALALGFIVCMLAAQAALSTLSEIGWLLWLGLLAPLAAGFRPTWFFLGLERVRRFVAIEVTMKASSIVLIVLFVSFPGDAWKVFAIYGATTTISTCIATGMMYRLILFRAPSIADAIRALRGGWDLFVFSASTSAYNMSNSVILGFVASPAIVGFYGAGERIIRSAIAMMLPMVQALYPRAARLAQDNLEEAARAVRLTVVVATTLAALGSVVLYLLAPLIIQVALGPGYEQAVPVLRILLLLLPILSISIPLTAHWMFPIGMDRLVTKVTVSGGLFHIPVAVLLGYQFGHVGIAWAFVVTESLILAVFMTMLITGRLSVHTAEMSGQDLSKTTV